MAAKDKDQAAAEAAAADEQAAAQAQAEEPREAQTTEEGEPTTATPHEPVTLPSGNPQALVGDDLKAAQESAEAGYADQGTDADDDERRIVFMHSINRGLMQEGTMKAYHETLKDQGFVPVDASTGLGNADVPGA